MPRPSPPCCSPPSSALFLAVQLFRWEKEEKIQPRNKLWVVAVLAPFVVMGSWKSYSKEHLGNNAALYRDLQRAGAFLIRNTRIFTGDGKVIENGAVLVRDGKIAAIYEGTAPDPDQLKAEVVEGAGKTLLPGLIDAHIHLAASGGISTDSQDHDFEKTMPRSAAALLYSGVTAARSVGDGLDASLKLRKSLADGARLGAQLFVCGPMFTAEGGHGTEFVEHLPAAIKDTVKAQLVRTPKTPEEARKQVRELKARGVDGIKAILEAGWGDGMLYDRLDLLLVRAVSEEAHAQHLPLATHTGDARDVADAVEIGSASVEHGSWRDEIPDRLLERMAADGVYLDPTLGVAEAYADYFDGKADVLNQFAGAAGGIRALAQGHARVRRFRQGRRPGQGGVVPARARHGARQPAARLEGRRAAGDGQRFGQSDGLPRAVAASRTAALGGGRNSGDR